MHGAMYLHEMIALHLLLKTLIQILDTGDGSVILEFTVIFTEEVL